MYNNIWSSIILFIQQTKVIWIVGMLAYIKVSGSLSGIIVIVVFGLLKYL
jgi:hypothetical protein